MTHNGPSGDDSVADVNDGIPAWITWSALALVATFAHTLIDVHIGLWGESSDEMQLIQAANALSQAAVYGWWVVVVGLAVAGDRWALRSAFLLAAVNAALFHGLVAITVAPPPSSGFPFQDIAHVASLATGVVAALFIWRRLRTRQPAGRSYVFGVTAAVILVAQVMSGLTVALT